MLTADQQLTQIIILDGQSNSGEPCNYLRGMLSEGLGGMEYEYPKTKGGPSTLENFC